jgi:hypothetical protein
LLRNSKALTKLDKDSKHFIKKSGKQAACRSYDQRDKYPNEKYSIHKQDDPYLKEGI